MLKYLVEKFKTHQSKIDDWFLEYEQRVCGEPVYASVDLRNAGYKIAPVDTNIFPAGFNNLCPSYCREAGKLFKNFIEKNYPTARRIAILAEEHTRNLFYFENLEKLSSIIQDAGFETACASLSQDLPQDENHFETAEKNSITIYKARVTGYLLKIKPWTPDLILVNNDFSSGIPAAIKKIVQPMVPTPLIGWHTRKKSHHFTCYQKLAKDFSKLIDIDTWLITACFRCMGEIDFTDPKSMTQLATKVDILLSEIRPKYKEYKIKSAPYVFVKNDAGTYGMAVMTTASGDDLLHLNKKDRTRMKMGKGKKVVSEVIIQEGIPTMDRFKEMVAEPVIYLVDNKVCGGFFRLNEEGDDRGNLNQPGMKFTKLCFHEMLGYSNEYKGQCDLECLAMIYKNIARIASLASGFEIKMQKIKEGL
ncbi:glutamate--cysteine ligase [Candidatus Peregrinibacteria bacterium]|nr:glutamate--cysteine ligase [Candidatus Peregrinibacteria bacterium]